MAYQGRDVLRGVSAVIEACKVLTIVGPSGAGKSTFLRALNRLTDHKSGEILLDGRPIDELHPVELRKRVGMVFQIPLAFQGTVEDNLLMGPRLTGSEEPDVPSLLERVGLGGGYSQRKASELSVGEQQRMCIARAIANNPEVLLMDEPTASLDSESSRKVEDLIVQLREEGGLTLVVATHNLGQARRIGDWTMGIRDGETEGMMETADFFERYGEGAV